MLKTVYNQLKALILGYKIGGIESNMNTAKVSIWKNAIMAGVVERKIAEEMKSSGSWEEWVNGSIRPTDRRFW